MSCHKCANAKYGKTLYDRTVKGRTARASRRTMRVVAGGAVLGLLATGGATALPAANAADFSGFSTFALAVPLRIEIYEPAIPIPASPQLELNLSYTKVGGTSGPVGTARASALWPGDAVGEGLKTFFETLGLPAAIAFSYPVQVNAQSPGEVGSATQELFPGMIGRVITNEESAIAKVGYGISGDVAEADSGEPNSLLDNVMSGDITALLGQLTGSSTAPSGQTPATSPLGPLSALVSAGAVESISRTSYAADADAVVATSTARVGSIALLGGIVKLDGVEVVTTVTSNLAGGAKVSRKVTIGAMSIAGNKFGLTGDGVEATGKSTPIPGLPDAPAAALAALGISLELGKANSSKEGSAGSVTAEGLRITIDTKPLLSKLPKLPLDDLVAALPDLPGQAAILKGLIIALGEATPKVSIVLGQSTSRAETVAAIGGEIPPMAPADGVGAAPLTDVPPVDDVPLSGGVDSGLPPIAGPDAPTVSTPLNPLSTIPGLPKLGELPTWLLLLGLGLAGGAGWYIRQAGLTLFGVATTCAHGLKAGIPDLRKV